jgi:hypothetical protein
VVVNTVVRMFARKAVGRAMKSASGKRKKDGPKKDCAKGAVLAALATWVTFGGTGQGARRSLQPPIQHRGSGTCRPSWWRSSSSSY